MDGDALLAGDAASEAAAVNALGRVAADAAAEGGEPPLMDPVADLRLSGLGECWDGRRAGGERARRDGEVKGGVGMPPLPPPSPGRPGGGIPTAPSSLPRGVLGEEGRQGRLGQF